MDLDFGNFIKTKRQEKNLTQKELANLLYVSPSAVSKWESGVAHPDISLLTKLADILGVTEKELITASIDNNAREEKKQAKKWRVLVTAWELFLYISYACALIPCFICNLAINKTLTWFWVVLSTVILSFTFTNLPKLIKKYKVIFIPLSNYLALCLLLGVVNIYTGGTWFFIPVVAVAFALITVFTPIYITKYNVFKTIRMYADYISVFISFVFLNILLIVINAYSNGSWYLKIALPICLAVLIVVNLLLCVRFLKVNKLIKTSIILFLTSLFVYIPPLFIKVKNTFIQKEIAQLNIFNANFSKWVVDANLETNIHCIIFITLLILSVLFLIFGLISNKKRRD